MKKKILGLTLIVVMLFGAMFILTGCGDNQTETSNVKDNNATNQDEIKENVVQNKNIDTEENKVADGLKLDARYKYSDSNLGIQIELYSDNTMYYTYIPRAENSDEYYSGTFTIEGNTLIMNLTPDGDNLGNNKVTQNGNTLNCTIISDKEFKDDQGRIIKYSIDYPKGLRPDER